MKTFLATLLLAAAIAPTLSNVAAAYTNCRTTCTWIGNMQTCRTTCY